MLYIDGIIIGASPKGPIVYWSFSADEYRILGVVPGYLNDEFPQEWTVNGQKVNEIVLANSGILIGYGITQAVDTIKTGETLNQCRP